MVLRAFVLFVLCGIPILDYTRSSNSRRERRDTTNKKETLPVRARHQRAHARSDGHFSFSGT